MMLGQTCRMACPGCSGHGRCVEGVKGSVGCVCVAGWRGDSCNEAEIGHCEYGQASTGEQGRCVGPQNDCDDEHTGATCAVCAWSWAGPGCTAMCTGCSGHGRCVDLHGDNDLQTCECVDGWQGPECSEKTSVTCVNSEGCGGSSRGVCLGGRCVCNEGFSGERCETCAGDGGLMCGEAVPCPAGCSGHGRCLVNGSCECTQGWEGESCSARAVTGSACQDDAGCGGLGRGECVSGRCACESGRTGQRCEACVGDVYGEGCEAGCSWCSGHGRCLGGGGDECECVEGWGGASCSERFLSVCVDVSGCGGSLRGECVDGQCQCINGYSGERCGTCGVQQVGGRCGAGCSGDETCSGHGRCLDDGDGGTLCECVAGWQGAACAARASATCANGSSCAAEGPGQCSSGVTGERCGVCAGGMAGADCAVPCSTAMNCSGHGRCIEASDEGAVCSCVHGWEGATCSVQTQRAVCADDEGCGGAGRGRCVDGRCNCSQGYSGERCDVCADQWAGGQCETACSVMETCSGHGRCVEDGGGSPTCLCVEGWGGASCDWQSALVCVNGSICGEEEGRGLCADGKCLCSKGFSGDRCFSCSFNQFSETCNLHCSSELSCSGQGRCQDDPNFLLDCSCVNGTHVTECQMKNQSVSFVNQSSTSPVSVFTSVASQVSQSLISTASSSLFVLTASSNFTLYYQFSAGTPWNPANITPVEFFDALSNVMQLTGGFGVPCRFSAPFIAVPGLVVYTSPGTIYPRDFFMSIETRLPSPSEKLLGYVSAVVDLNDVSYTVAANSQLLIILGSFPPVLSRRLSNAGSSLCPAGTEWRYVSIGAPDQLACACPANRMCSGETVCSISPKSGSAWVVKSISSALCNATNSTKGQSILIGGGGGQSMVPIIVGVCVGVGLAIILTLVFIYLIRNGTIKMNRTKELDLESGIKKSNQQNQRDEVGDRLQGSLAARKVSDSDKASGHSPPLPRSQISSGHRADLVFYENQDDTLSVQSFGSTTRRLEPEPSLAQQFKAGSRNQATSRSRDQATSASKQVERTSSSSKTKKASKARKSGRSQATGYDGSDSSAQDITRASDPLHARDRGRTRGSSARATREYHEQVAASSAGAPLDRDNSRMETSPSPAADYHSTYSARLGRPMDQFVLGPVSDARASARADVIEIHRPGLIRLGTITSPSMAEMRRSGSQQTDVPGPRQSSSGQRNIFEVKTYSHLRGTSNIFSVCTECMMLRTYYGPHNLD